MTKSGFKYLFQGEIVIQSIASECPEKVERLGFARVASISLVPVHFPAQPMAFNLNL
jgi:hypothetical protein